MIFHLETPFPYFGGKSKVADIVWQGLGDVPNYVEPFFGSGAVLLRRPAGHKGNIETANDKDGLVCNFWRAISADPEKTAFYADWPVNENDLTARHIWLVNQKESLQIRLEGDPEYYDPKIAGWWAWGMSCWIGSGFCSGQGPWQSVDGQLVHLLGAQGVNRKRVHLSGAYTPGIGVNSKKSYEGKLYDWFEALSNRLRRVRVCCGDWKRVLGPSPTFKLGLTGIFLDPPYSFAERSNALYCVEEDISREVAKWAIDNGDNPLLRIALCGYEGEYTMPNSWEVYRWKTIGGYGSQGKGRGRENAKREVIYFSPYCLKAEQGKLINDERINSVPLNMGI